MLSAAAQADGLAQGGVVEAGRDVHRQREGAVPGGLRRGVPGRRPMLVRERVVRVKGQGEGECGDRRVSGHRGLLV